jgi:hypothetical protein
MTLKVLTRFIAAAVCVFAASSARAVVSGPGGVTNVVTFDAVSIAQDAPTTNGSIVTFHTKSGTANTASLLSELGQALIHTNFSASAKLMLISGESEIPFFAVIDGVNSYNLSSLTNTDGTAIMSLSGGDVQITSGTKSDQTIQQNRTQMQQITVSFDDSGLGANDLTFNLTGMAVYTESRTTPVAGEYTDTVKGKISSMTGTGSYRGAPFVATGTISFSGKATLPVITT